MKHIKNLTRRQILPPFVFVLVLCSFLSCEEKSAGIDYANACPVLDSVDFQMNELYNELLLKHHTQNQFIKNLKQSQVMWTQYRNTMTTLYMDQDKRVRDYSEEQKNCRCGKMAEFTINRIQELSVFRKEQLSEVDACW